MKPTRRNIAHISQAERDKLIDAIVELDTSKQYPDGVSYWDKQDQIHQGTHVHGGASFLTWHRELLNRFEALLQEIDPTVALHYWDWTTDPRNTPDGQGGFVNLFTSSNFGSSSGRAGPPFDTLDNGGTLAGSRDQTGDPSDPPQEIVRNTEAGDPPTDADIDIITSADSLPQEEQWSHFRTVLERSPNHNRMHSWVGGPGGTISPGHSSFEDPFVFIMHSNIDRIWAMWQTVPGQEWRLDADQVYGNETNDPEILEALEPWSGTVHFGDPVPPWDPSDPDNEIVVKNSRHPSVVQPPCYDTLPLSVELTSPTSGAPITFNDVPEGAETVRAAVFSIRACEDITLEITSGPGAGFGTPLGSTFSFPYTSVQPTSGYVWISYQGTTANAATSGSVTIHCNETGDDWVIPITANTIEKPKAASMLILDKSGSMSGASGISGQSRLDVLKWAAPHYIQAMGDNDGIGITSFDHDAYPVMPVTTAGSLMFGAGRSTALAAITAHDEDGGSTSIGDGLDLAHATIDPVSGYDHKSLIVFTDGHENTAQYISDVSGLLNERVFAIGLGRADQLDVSVLDSLTSGSGGYLVITGDLDVSDQFRVSKYFLQILAGVTNTAIVVDPESSVRPGTKHRIPFTLTGADTETDIILLSPEPGAIDFYLETPKGDQIGPSEAALLPGVSFAEADTLHLYRASLPIPVGGAPAHAGEWHAVVSVSDDAFKKYLSNLRERKNMEWSASSAVHGIPYNLSVHARSNLQLRAFVVADSHEPRAQANLRAVITESDLATGPGAIVHVKIVRPDSTAYKLRLSETSTGTFEGTISLTLAGVYQLHFMATGTTRRGESFAREEFRSVGIAHNADTPRPRRPESQGSDLCQLLDCLLADDRMLKLLDRLDLDPRQLRACLKDVCGERKRSESRFSRRSPETKTLEDLRQILVRPEFRDLIARMSDPSK